MYPIWSGLGCWTWTLVFSLWKEFTPTWNRSTSRILLQSSQCCLIFNHLLKNLFFFYCAFAHLIMLSYKSCMDRVSVICKLALKWYACAPADCVPLIIKIPPCASLDVRKCDQARACVWYITYWHPLLNHWLNHWLRRLSFTGLLWRAKNLSVYTHYDCSAN